MLVYILSACLSAGTAFAAVQNASFDPLQYVNQLIGTDNGGNVFAGATLPYGMAKAVADVSGQNTAGFSTDGTNVTGFSHMHDSGTGGNPSMGNFPIFPQVCADDDINNCKYAKYDRAVNYVNNSLKTTPGYFALTLNSGIAAEMTTTEHTALYSFKFPSSSLSPMIVLDLTDLYDTRQNATIEIADDGRLKGNGTFIPSFGSGSYVSHFCADFNGLALKDTGMFVNSRAGHEPKSLFVERGINLFYIQAGSFVRFDSSGTNTVNARVGMSFISADQACKNAESEIPGPVWDFDGIKASAEKAWREKLSVVSVKTGGVSDRYLTNFYSAVYRTMMSPQDYTGENPDWQSSEPYFDSFYCIWDAFRSQLPFLTIIDPHELSRMLRSLLDIYKHRGWLPDCSMSLCKGFTQGGSNADIVLTDGYLKNITGPDWGLAYEAIVNDAENEPLAWSVNGRGGLMSWKSLNYIPALDYDYLGFGTNSRSISRTLEYSYDDFCLSTLAKGIGKPYEKYLARSGNWQNLFKADQTSAINGTDTGFIGFFQPKFLNQTWGYQDPIQCSPLDEFCSLTSNPTETFESSIWEYQFFVPQDHSTLISLLGGPSTFVKRLDYLHESGLIDIGNEISFLTVFQYHYAGRPGLSSKRAHYYFPSRFNDSTTGLPGNDDTGAMGSFTAFVMSGLFPNAGQDVYLIAPPFFEEVSYTSPQSNKTATIRNKNFDPGYGNIYVQSATLDGKPYTKSWIGHSFFLEGGTLELTLGANESSWGTREEDLPPSTKAGQMELLF
ncbi:MAG: hypothetical protein MMC23_000173 [Stictis urceolatum]|nr:hypothetical protein [Stictis urceolata]